MTSGHHLRASADMGAFSSSSPLGSRGIRPASEVYFTQSQGQASNNAEDAAEKAAQQWIADIDQYETTLEDMAAATLDQDFKDELSAIEQWFRVLSEPERTAALYALLQQTTQLQIRFFIQVLQQMAKSHPMSGVLSPANFAEKGVLSAAIPRKYKYTWLTKLLHRSHVCASDRRHEQNQHGRLALLVRLWETSPVPWRKASLRPRSQHHQLHVPRRCSRHCQTKG